MLIEQLGLEVTVRQVGPALSTGEPDGEAARAERLEVAARFAGGIAQELNDLLSAIAGYNDLILSRMSESNPLRRDAGEIEHAVERASTLTRQLLAIARRQVFQPRTIDLNALVVGLEPGLRELCGVRVALELALDLAGPRVRASSEQLEQALLLLAESAVTAMGGEGTLRISTSSTGGDGDEDGPRLARLAVADTGPPVDEAARSTLFEPFATAAPGRGPGLGLAAVYGIVSQCGGRLDVSAGEGRTTIAALLPAVDPVAELAPVTSGRETVLVAEDEDAIRLMLCESLERHGYRVLPARDGPEALTVAGGHTGTIDLLLTDVVMPRMDGVALAREIRESRPATRVLYMSGSPAEAVVRDLEQLAGTGFITKPITPSALVLRIRQALAEPLESG
ncbi:MAG: response regulator [Gaiellales bacterium]